MRASVEEFRSLSGLGARCWELAVTGLAHYSKHRLPAPSPLSGRGLRPFLVRAPGRRGARPGRARLAAASLFEASPQAFHEVDDFGVLWLGRRLEVHLPAFDLALNDAHQVFAVLVGIFRRVPFR